MVVWRCWCWCYKKTTRVRTYYITTLYNKNTLLSIPLPCLLRVSVNSHHRVIILRRMISRGSRRNKRSTWCPCLAATRYTWFCYDARKGRRRWWSRIQHRIYNIPFHIPLWGNKGSSKNNSEIQVFVLVPYFHDCWQTIPSINGELFVINFDIMPAQRLVHSEKIVSCCGNLCMHGSVYRYLNYIFATASIS